jgi:hypothetical protein
MAAFGNSAKTLISMTDLVLIVASWMCHSKRMLAVQESKEPVEQ